VHPNERRIADIVHQKEPQQGPRPPRTMHALIASRRIPSHLPRRGGGEGGGRRVFGRSNATAMTVLRNLARPPTPRTFFSSSYRAANSRFVRVGSAEVLTMNCSPSVRPSSFVPVQPPTNAPPFHASRHFSSSSSSTSTSSLPSITYQDGFIRSVLSSTKTIAMVGASPNWNRPSYFAMKYLQGNERLHRSEVLLPSVEP
jgi:hypothetical protein